MRTHHRYTADIYYSFSRPSLGVAGFEVGLEGASAVLSRTVGEERTAYEGTDYGSRLELRGPDPESEIVLYRSAEGRELVGKWREHGQEGLMRLIPVPSRPVGR